MRISNSNGTVTFIGQGGNDGSWNVEAEALLPRAISYTDPTGDTAAHNVDAERFDGAQLKADIVAALELAGRE